MHRIALAAVVCFAGMVFANGPRFSGVTADAPILLDFYLLGADDFETRVSAQDRLRARLRGPNRSAVLSQATKILCAGQDPEVLYRIDQVLGRRQSRDVPRSPEAVYATLYDPQFADQLLERPGNIVVEATALAMRLAPLVRVEFAALQKLEQTRPRTEKEWASWTAEARRIGALLAREEVRLEDVENCLHLRPKGKNFSVTLELVAEDLFRWRPGPPLSTLLWESGQRAASPFCLAQAPRSDTVADVPLWNATIIQRGKNIEVDLEPYLDEDLYRAFLLRAFQPAKGQSEQQWQEQVAALAPRMPSALGYSMHGARWVRRLD